MGYLLSTFWFWLLLAAILGVVVGWMTREKGANAGWSGLIPWAAALALGGLVAFLQLLPQRLGYWLDLGLLMLAAYVIGCCLAVLLAGKAAGEAPAAETKPAPRVMPVLEVPVEPMKPATEPAPAEASEEAITGLSAPRGGKGDDLTRIYGIDPETESKLNGLGLYHYDQIASLTPGQRRWLFRQLGHGGRFPSWWWRWRYDAERILAGGDVAVAAPVKPAKGKAAKTPKAAPEPAPQPEQAVAPLAEEGFEGARPVGLAAPREGRHDDLKRIRGIGKQNEGRLHGLGIWHFDQIAGWSADEVKWVGGYLAFPGRIEREEWVSQAGVLAAGGDTEFSKRADAGRVATSRDDTADNGQSNVIATGTAAGEKPKGRKR